MFTLVNLIAWLASASSGLILAMFVVASDTPWWYFVLLIFNTVMTYQAFQKMPLSHVSGMRWMCLGIGMITMGLAIILSST